MSVGDIPQRGQLTPDMCVQPGPFAFGIAGIDQPDGSRIVRLLIEHTTGSTALFLTVDGATQMAKMLTEEAEGGNRVTGKLIVPSLVPPADITARRV